MTDVSRRAPCEEILVRVPAPTAAESTTFYYPGWTVTIDGAPAAVSPVPVRGTMRVALPAGEHRVVIALRPTPVRWTGMLVTAVPALSLLAAAAVALRRNLPSASSVPSVYCGDGGRIRGRPGRRPAGP